MIMKTKIMSGYILVSEDVLNQDQDLHWWINLALEFNPHAKASKKSKSKAAKR